MRTATLLLPLLPLLLLPLAACSTAPSPEANLVTEADEKMVANCRFVATVSGSSLFGAGGASIGMARSKNEAREQAAALGATHVVWQSVSGGYSSSASGMAYKC